jgi:hypothetical protein
MRDLRGCRVAALCWMRPGRAPAVDEAAAWHLDRVSPRPDVGNGAPSRLRPGNDTGDDEPASVVEMTAPARIASPSRPREGTGNDGKRWGSTVTQTRGSEAMQRSDLHLQTRLLIRRFGVRIPGGPPDVVFRVMLDVPASPDP